MSLTSAARYLAAGFLSVTVVAAGTIAAQPAPSLAGLWDAVVVVNDVEVPFPFEIADTGSSLAGSFFNGERRITSTAATRSSNHVLFRFDQYATTLDATLVNSELRGEYRRARGGPLSFRAVRKAANVAAAASGAPAIGGTWVVQARSNKGETAWRFIVRQEGDRVDATILRVDGDTGTLSGSWRDGAFVLSHFSGARPLLLEVTPNSDGTLALSQNRQPPLLAAREAERASARVGTPTDPALHTRLKDAAEPLRFSFPNLDGQIVSNTDAQFQGKVVLVNISGSWCPNCHDEAPFLAALDKKYRGKGLEIVTLSFEEADQLADPVRLKAFIATYGLEYTVLLPGEPDQLNEKVPQAENLNAFPTTFLLGRDGRVRAVHAGFPSPGSGAFYTKAEQDITTQVERLLAEPARSR